MTAPLKGVRVVDLGMWVAGPAAAAVLAEWGADVVKLEPPGGDPMRKFFSEAAGFELPETPPFDLDNRGKRSVVLDLRSPSDRDRALRMIAGADVFVTNLRTAALREFGLDADSVLATHPRLIYALITAYGQAGSDADGAGYDIGAFWSRSGLASAHTPEGQPLATIRPGVGDHITAMNLVAGIAAALYRRERTGKGEFVETSLLRSGIYCMGYDLGLQLRWGTTGGTYPRDASPNPLANSYRAADGRWFWLLGVQAARHWEPFLRAIGKEEWADDHRFATPLARGVNASILIGLLDDVFATEPRDHWTQRFDEQGVWWAPAHTVAEVITDPQATSARAFVDVPSGGAAREHRGVATPVDFASHRPAPRSGVPGLGEHTHDFAPTLP